MHLTNTDDVYIKHRKSHAASCASDQHPELPNLVRSLADREQITWCVDPFTGIQRKLDVPRSVLSLRHACKQINEEMRYMFFALNEFHFRDAECAKRAFSGMMQQAAAAIEVMGFRFYGDGAPKLYPMLAEACPNVRVLKVSMSPDDKQVIISGLPKSLRRARGVEAFASYISGLEKLETFEVVGTDYVNETVDGIETSVQVDINHPHAIGPWFKAKIEMGKVQRQMIGREVIEREKREKERKEKELKEKRKAQRKKSEERRAERERERQRLELERQERERKEIRRLDRERQKLEGRDRRGREKNSRGRGREGRRRDGGSTGSLR